MSCIEREFYIPYPENTSTRVYMKCMENGPRFVVFLAGEEGNVIVYSQTDAAGNETWYEGDGIASQSAAEIGKRMEIE
ncbi:hypothetical protein [Filimonas lacunae]|nr:hypothetical protein [Filimonas lacunae]BAV09716.1 hypothetical protein FLA_5769 [Filimonas lacunae]